MNVNIYIYIGIIDLKIWPSTALKYVHKHLVSIYNTGLLNTVILLVFFKLTFI